MLTPSTIKAYLQNHFRVSLNDLAIHFDSEPEMVKSAIFPWIKKGLVQEITNNCSKGCSKSCASGTTIIYQWNK